MLQAHKQHALLALYQLRQAMDVARESLPAHVQREYAVEKRHSPNPWRAIEARYIPGCSPDSDLLVTLTDLALMGESLAALMTVALTAERAESRPVDLSLKKTRRTA